MIWIRADGNGEIGMGHMVRCLAIASALRELGEDVCFLTADDSAVSFLEQKGQSCKILHGSYARLEEELGALLPILAGGGAGALLVDSYYATGEYLRRAGTELPVCRMDDMGIADLPADMVINYNIFADESLYPGAGKEEKTVYLTGTKYAPLRPEFRGISYQAREKAEKVLITTGGSDRYYLAGQILERALEMPDTGDLEYCVVSGAFNVHGGQLARLAEGHKNVHIYNNVTEMARLMQECDIAVTAGGSTMYELCAVGVPAICFSFVDNQEKIVEGFRDRGLVSFGGDYLRQGQDMVKHAAEHIGILKNDAGLRRSLSKKMREQVDGQGANRIAEALAKLVITRKA